MTAGGLVRLPSGAVVLTRDQADTVAAALAEAADARTERAAAYCYECASHPAGACESHLDDLDRAQEYRELGRQLEGGEVPR